jgi:hypothetical protein
VVVRAVMRMRMGVGMRVMASVAVRVLTRVVRPTVVGATVMSAAMMPTAAVPATMMAATVAAASHGLRNRNAQHRHERKAQTDQLVHRNVLPGKVTAEVVLAGRVHTLVRD